MKTDKPWLSFLIPTYNRRDLLEQTLQTVMQQDEMLENTEIIISNDCSKDDTESFLRLYQQENPHLNIKIFNHKENLGGPGNWEFLLSQAQGEFVFLLSDDDWIAPQFLVKYKNVIDSNPHIDLVYSAFDYRDDNMQSLSLSDVSSVYGETSGLDRVKNQMRSNHMVMSAMYRTRVLRSAGGWQKKYGTCLDGAAFALSCLKSRRTFFINHPLFIFRVGTQTWSSFKVEKQKPVYVWYRLLIDDMVSEVRKAHPKEVSFFKGSYKSYAQGVLNMLDIKFINGNLSRMELKQLLGDLSSVYPEARELSSFWKMKIVSYFGSGWLVLIRKLLKKPDIKSSSVFEKPQLAKKENERWG